MAKVTFIGLGVMGYPMAGHLKNRGGHEVTVFNRTAAKAERWAEEFGGKAAPTPAEAAEGADFVFTCVGNDDDLRSVTTAEDGAFSTIRPGAIFIDNTTASAAVARELAAVADERGFGFLAHGARYVLLSVVRQDITFSDPEFHKREATLFASRNAQPDDFAEVVRQIEAGKVPTRALNTHRGRLEDDAALLVEWARPEAGVIKAILEV